MSTQQFLDAYAKMPRGYQYHEASGVGLFAFPAFSKTGLVNHGFTARKGGVSKGNLASLNLSFNREEDSRESVLENYRLFAARAGIHWESMVMDTFEHGTTVLKVGAAEHGAGYLRPSLPFCDGLITDRPGTALVTGHADCVPLYLLDPHNGCIGLAHAGWKGTLGKIGLLAVQKMIQLYGCDPRHMLAGIGPCICRDCFEVDESLAAKFEEAFPHVPLASPGRPGAEGKAQLDLPMACAAQFLEAGIMPENISIMEACTFEDPARLYSHRRDHGNTGGMVAFLQLLVL